MNAQWIATVASVGALAGLFFGVGLPVLQQPEAVAPINVRVPVTDVPVPPRERAGADDDAAADDGRSASLNVGEQDDDRDDRSRMGPVSGDGDDDDAADDDGDDD